jgi:uncharacterized delta-60 repeat protein
MIGFAATDDRAKAVAIQGDGRIVLAGDADGPPEDIAVARLRADGSLDPSFSGNGKRILSFSSDEGGDGVAVQANGRIVVGGHALIGGNSNWTIARLRADGSLDPSFSGDGRRTVSFVGGSAAEVVADLAIQHDGRIVVVGQVGGDDFGVARLNPGGSLDTSFSGDGRRRIDFLGDPDTADAVALDGAGRIVVAGTSRMVNDADWGVVRLRTGGGLDTSFSGDGKRRVNFGGLSDQGTGVAVTPGGAVVVGGISDGGTDFAFAAARLRPNGSLDPSFSGDGKRSLSVAPDNDFAADLALQQDGRIVLVGESDGTANFGVARLNPNGSPDTSFSGDGRLVTDFGGGNEIALAVAIQRNGRIVAAGVAPAGANDEFGVARYLP